LISQQLLCTLPLLKASCSIIKGSEDNGTAQILQDEKEEHLREKK